MLEEITLRKAIEFAVATEATGEKHWDCKVFSVGEHFDLAAWSR